jgi:hypothetical protein
MHRKKGQAIVEMALVFPLFLLVIVGGIIDFGFAMYNALTLQQIANESAQWAADNLIKDSEEITNYITDKKPDWWKGDFAEPGIQIVDLQSGGKVIKVGLRYGSQTYTPLYQAMLKGASGSPAITLTAMASYKYPQHLQTRL